MVDWESMLSLIVQDSPKSLPSKTGCLPSIIMVEEDLDAYRQVFLESLITFVGPKQVPDPWFAPSRPYI